MFRPHHKGVEHYWDCHHLLQFLIVSFRTLPISVLWIHPIAVKISAKSDIYKVGFQMKPRAFLEVFRWQLCHFSTVQGVRSFFRGTNFMFHSSAVCHKLYQLKINWVTKANVISITKICFKTTLIKINNLR